MTLKSALPGSEALLCKAQECLGPNRLPLLIAIDGADGIGKSSLASWLAWQLGAPAIHLDLYLVRGSDPLRWRTDELQRAVDTRLLEHAKPLVVEEILILDALDKIGRKPDFLVYVDGEGSHSLSDRLADYKARHRPEQRAQFHLKGFEDHEPPPPEPEASADYIQHAAPRLVKVAAITAISFALWDGANRVLLDRQESREDVREIVAGYREGTVSVAALRLMVLLDADPNVVSFQSVYRRLNRVEVVDELVRRGRTRSPLADALEDQVDANIRASVRNFLDTYKAFDWHDLHGRLQHFRNHGIAHLLPQPIKKRVSCAEIDSLVRSVTVMGECMASFDPDGVPLRVDEIADWSDRAKVSVASCVPSALEWRWERARHAAAPTTAS